MSRGTARRQPIRALLAAAALGDPVTATGWVKTSRFSKNVSFVHLFDGSTPQTVQVILKDDASADRGYRHRATLLCSRQLQAAAHGGTNALLARRAAGRHAGGLQPDQRARRLPERIARAIAALRRIGDPHMTYAGDRRIIDVDSHVIELDDFLHEVATPSERALLPAMADQTILPVSEAGLARGRELFAKRQADPAVMSKFEASLTDGCYTFMVDTNEPNPEARAFTYPDFDAVWARFSAAGCRSSCTSP